MKEPKVTVKTNEQEPESIEIIAASIIEIAAAMKKIENSRLTRKAVVILISAHSKIPKGIVEIVLNCTAALEELYIKSKPTK